MQGRCRVFTHELHERFARVSGDTNPIHMDPVHARRTHAAAPIVHGIHTLLWTLDCFASSEFAARPVRSLRAQFLQPIYVGDTATLEFAATSDVLRARVLVNAQEVVTVSFGAQERAAAPSGTWPHVSSALIHNSEKPNELDLEAMQGQSGRLAFSPFSREMDTLFAAAVERFGLDRVAALACTSSLVGMIVPGLHSMFMGLEVSFNPDEMVRSHSLLFSVQGVTPRFRSVRIAIIGPGVRGVLDTVSRLPPIRQPSFRSLREKVGRESFQASTALVIGGSRGLGELAAKLISAGGARTIVTFASGKADAESVVEEIVADGGRCSAMKYDALLPAAEQLNGLDVAPTHVYYFATPRIARRKAGLFDAERLAEFHAYYVRGFFDLVSACYQLTGEHLRVFHPSSTYVDTRPAGMTEYAMSKAAAEVLCHDLPRLLPKIRVVSERLPPLPTDQTSSVVRGTWPDPVDVFLPIVRKMHT